MKFVFQILMKKFGIEQFLVKLNLILLKMEMEKQMSAKRICGFDSLAL